MNTPPPTPQALGELVVELASPPSGLTGPVPFGSLVSASLPSELADAEARPLWTPDLELASILERAVPTPTIADPGPTERFVRVRTDLPASKVRSLVGPEVVRAWRPPQVVPSSAQLAALAPGDPMVLFQGYLEAPIGSFHPTAPARSEWGVNALAVLNRPGGMGEGARLTVLEGGFWLPDGVDTWRHADLPPLHLLWGDNLASWKSHGLKDLGIICAQPNNDVGLRGIANQAQVAPVSLAPPGTGTVDVYDALKTALVNSAWGDVVHLAWTTEVDVTSGTASSPVAVPPQVDPAVRHLIALGTMMGVTIVQASGNHSEDLGAFAPADPAFAGAFSVNIGAPIVGACNAFDGRWKYPSGYGHPVRHFAWGTDVATLDKRPSVPYDGYTSGYDGTSSASAIFSACATVIQGMMQTQRGHKLHPLILRYLLYISGTPPTGGTELSHARMPNLGAAAQLLGL